MLLDRLRITLSRLRRLRRTSNDRLAIDADADHLLWALADAQGRLSGCGRLSRGDDAPAAWARRVGSLALPGREVIAVLALEQAQFVQVDAPAVKPEELKAAARWRIKDQIEGRLDEMTIDVMFVGDDRPRPQRQLFVAAARNELIRHLGERSEAAGLTLAAIDVAEAAQRNLQSALAAAGGLGERATAALVRHGAHCLLTVCAGGELFYARRLEGEGSLLPQPAPTPGALAAAAVAAAAASSAPMLAFESMDFVDYGADDDPRHAQADAEAPRLVIELQRSFDVWERSWPDLPLAALWVQVGEGSERVAAMLSQQLGQRVSVLDPAEIFPELTALAPDRSLREALLPLLGALLRTETRRL